MIIQLPISKSIANRLLMAKAMRGDDLNEVVASSAFATYPDDVRLLATHLLRLQRASRIADDGTYRDKDTDSIAATASSEETLFIKETASNKDTSVLELDCANAGTVIRFLTAYCAQLQGREVVLTGSKRMQQRPIGQLVDALRMLGADIEYLQQEGYPPLRIRGRQLKTSPIHLSAPLHSTQFVSALLLIGVQVTTDVTSPYIDLTQSVLQQFREGSLTALHQVERDWSAAAFWLEREALGLAPAPYVFPGLKDDSPQGDRVARELFQRIHDHTLRSWDFSACPDLYPAAAVACHLLHLHPTFTGLETLPLKESDRLTAVRTNLQLLDNHLSSNTSSSNTPSSNTPSSNTPSSNTPSSNTPSSNTPSSNTSSSFCPSLYDECIVSSYNDHRIAMAFLAAGIAVDDTLCISKSYPAFLSQLLHCTRVVALREGEKYDSLSQENTPLVAAYDGLITRVQSDEGKGKKYALLKAIEQVDTEYVWLCDADILPPPMPASLPDADMIILPLRMEALPDLQGHPFRRLGSRLMQLEYAAIQALTVCAAQKGLPVMCSGANMIVRRSAWLECAAELHADIPSGDDMFMLEAMKRHHKTIVMGPSRLTATCFPPHSFSAFLKQRMRWAGKAPHYSDPAILLCGLLTLLSNLLVYLLPGWFILHYAANMHLLRRYAPAITLTAQDYLIAVLLVFVYPLYMLISLIGGLLRKSW